jgi:drug/metabolite transporter (DMT)-like permease
LKTTAFVTTALTVAGGSWYVAVDMTSPSDLTAIYNCSAFFAYAFSIPLLGDKLRFDKIFSVGLAIVGVLVVAYGDSGDTKHGGKSGGSVGGKPKEPASEDTEAKNRALGNLVIGVGSVLYGLYEVLYKKWACPPEGTSPGRGMAFAMTFGSLIGCFTLFVLWIPIPILHVTGLEIFEAPTGKVAAWLLVSTLANASEWSICWEGTSSSANHSSSSFLWLLPRPHITYFACTFICCRSSYDILGRYCGLAAQRREASCCRHRRWYAHCRGFLTFEL